MNLTLQGNLTVSVNNFRFSVNIRFFEENGSENSFRRQKWIFSGIYLLSYRMFRLI